MRVQALVLAGLLGVLALEGVSHAEKVRANDSAKIYNRPGEQGKIILKVKEGQAMTVLAKQGRWIKVRVKGRTGFVPRSKVSAPDGDEEIARNTRRRPFVDGRSTKRTFGGGGDAPEDRVGADAVGDNEEGGEEGEDEGEEKGGGDEGEEEDPKPKKAVKKPKPEPKKVEDDEEEIDNKAAEEEEPADAEEVEEEEKDPRKRARVASKTMTFSEADKDSDESFEASPKDQLFIEQSKGKWSEVSVEEGDIGWVLTSKLEIDEDEGDEDDDGGGGSRGGRRIDLRARLGITLFSQKLASPGAMALDNYGVGSSAAAVSLGGALVYPYKKAYLVGGELMYDIAKALPGISYENKTTAFTLHNLNIRGLFGYDFKKDNGMVVFGRLGYHYEQLLFADVEDLTKNNAMLPSETLKGPMLGVMFAIPALTKKFGARISLDAILLGGSLSQTKGLEDGQSPSLKKYVFGAGGIYRYKPGWDINFGYDLNYASLSFGAAVVGSMRQHGASASRTDLNHTVSVGLAKAL